MLYLFMDGERGESVREGGERERESLSVCMYVCLFECFFVFIHSWILCTVLLLMLHFFFFFFTFELSYFRTSSE